MSPPLSSTASSAATPAVSTRRSPNSKATSATPKTRDLGITELRRHHRRATVSGHAHDRVFGVFARSGDAGTAATGRCRAGRLGSPPGRPGPPAERSHRGGFGDAAAVHAITVNHRRAAAPSRRSGLVDGDALANLVGQLVGAGWQPVHGPIRGAGRRRSGYMVGGRCRICWCRRCAARAPAFGTAANRTRR